MPYKKQKFKINNIYKNVSEIIKQNKILFCKNLVFLSPHSSPFPFPTPSGIISAFDNASLFLNLVH